MNAFEKPWNAEEVKAGLLELLQKFKQSPAEIRFAEIYETMLHVLHEDLPLKHALAYLETKGLKLSPATFKKYAARQAKNRSNNLKGSNRKDSKPRKRKVDAAVATAPTGEAAVAAGSAKKAGDEA